MIMAKAVIFDTDSTLVDTIERFFGVFNEMLAAQGSPPLGWDEFYRRYVADSLDELAVPRKAKRRKERLHSFWMEFLRKYREENPNGKIYPGVKSLLRKLHAVGIPVAVITSCIVPSSKLREELAGLGVDAFVDACATAHDVVNILEMGDHFSKVEIIKKAAENLRVRPEDCVVVGDYWNDVKSGKEAGAKTVGVLSGLARREMLEKYGADAIINNTMDLLKVVDFELLNTTCGEAAHEKFNCRREK